MNGNEVNLSENMDEEDSFEVDGGSIQTKTPVNAIYINTDVNITNKEIDTIEQPCSDDSDLFLTAANTRIQTSKMETSLSVKQTTEQHTNVSETFTRDVDKVREVEITKAPDGGWGWFIILGSLLLRTTIGGLVRSNGLFYIQFQERYGATATATALVVSLTGFVRLAAGPFVSALCNRFTCRTLTGVGTCLLFLGIMTTAFAPNLPFIYFSYSVVGGLGRAFVLTPVPLLLGYYFDKRRSLAFGLASAGFSIGGVAITPIVEILFQNFGFQGTFLVLSALVTHVFISTSLFRPIELQRKFIQQDRMLKIQLQSPIDQLSSLEDMEIKKYLLNGSHSSLYKLECKTKLQSNNGLQNVSNSQTKLEEDNAKVRKEQNDTVATKCTTENNEILKRNNTNRTSNGIKAEVSIENNVDKEQTVTLLEQKEYTQTETKRYAEDVTEKKKTKFIRWSVLKDVRFLSFLLATMCFTLQSGGLFLPSLAKSRGVSQFLNGNDFDVTFPEIQAASLLSTNAAFDTISRVLAGFILDMNVFRSRRPIIFNLVTYMQAFVMFLYPLMMSFRGFFILCAVDGLFCGIRNAQGSVIMLDLLGVDKFASSMSLTMSVQCIAILIGPTISGQLRDIYGTYDGAFYFAAAAMLTGAVVLTIGNMWKHLHDKAKNSDLDKDVTNTENA